MEIDRWQLFAIPIVIVCLVIIPHVDTILRDYQALFLFQGTGLQGTAAHSVDNRMGAFLDTLQVFCENPFIGRSLGGSPSIAAMHAFHPQTVEESKLYEGLSVFAEILAASGLIGILPFLIFLYQTIVIPGRLANDCRENSLGKVLHALGRAMIYEWMILQVDQNILPPCVWMHLTIICVVVANLESERRSKQVHSMLWTGESTCGMKLSTES